MTVEEGIWGAAQLSNSAQVLTRVEDSRSFAVVEDHALKGGLQFVVSPPNIGPFVVSLHRQSRSA